MKNKVKIGTKEMTIPIIQGGMGVGVSLSSLAGAVMKEGGMGVISAAHPGYRDPLFWKDSLAANKKALKEEIQKAKDISGGNGICGVNIMVASKDYDEYVVAAAEGKAEAIISGAGMPMNLPALVKGYDILIAPIVSSARAAKLILRSWSQRDDRCADFVVVEGCEAGGHLGFKKEDVINGNAETLEEILPQVLQEVAVYEEKYEKEIPVFVAGGIFTGQDIAKYIKLGAAGVQMATRFIATYECDADQRFKDHIIQSTQANIELVGSPAGLPGRAVMTPFMETTKCGRIAPTRCITCMKPCIPATTPYCITDALIKAVQGDIEHGLVFAGSNAYRVTKMMHVHDLISELMHDGIEEEAK